MDPIFFHSWILGPFAGRHAAAWKLQSGPSTGAGKMPERVDGPGSGSRRGGLKSGIIQLPIWGRIKQCKCMVKFEGFPLNSTFSLFKVGLFSWLYFSRRMKVQLKFRPCMSHIVDGMAILGVFFVTEWANRRMLLNFYFSRNCSSTSRQAGILCMWYPLRIS